MDWPSMEQRPVKLLTPIKTGDLNGCTTELALDKPVSQEQRAGTGMGGFGPGHFNMSRSCHLRSLPNTPFLSAF